jgi:hypothetical protein
VADLIAYVISWAFRIPGRLAAPARDELRPFADQVSALRYRTTREKLASPGFVIWSFAIIDDLRGWEDQMEAEKEKRQ